MSWALEPGTTLRGRYRVDGFLGAGGMGAVYAGTDLETGDAVALKLLTLHHRTDLLRRFEREARLLARVRHPNVVSVLSYTTHDEDAPCIIMELVQGEGLDVALRRQGALEWGDAVGLALGICAGLEAIHAQGIVHRDLKPSNVLVSPGTPPVPRLIDLGVARQDGDGEDSTRLTRDGALVGTPTYLSPEQVLGQPVDRRADLYAVGLVLHEMLTGQVPFGDGSMGGALRRVGTPIPQLTPPRGRPEIPPALDAAVRAALAADPALRPASAAALRQRLENLLSSTPAGTGWQPRSDPARSASSSGASLAPLPSLSSRRTDALTWAPEAPPDPTEATVLLDRGRASEARAAERARYLLVVRLPPSRLAHPEDRSFLAGLAGTHARSFVVGAGLWVALQVQGVDVDAADDDAVRIATALRARYGGAARTEWTTVSDTFRLSAAALVGGQALPPELVGLIERVSSA